MCVVNVKILIALLSHSLLIACLEEACSEHLPRKLHDEGTHQHGLPDAAL